MMKTRAEGETVLTWGGGEGADTLSQEEPTVCSKALWLQAAPRIHYGKRPRVAEVQRTEVA